MMLANRVKCRTCSDVVESIHETDWKTCRCGHLAVYGGVTAPGWVTSGPGPDPETQYVFYKND